MGTTVYGDHCKKLTPAPDPWCDLNGFNPLQPFAAVGDAKNVYVQVVIPFGRFKTDDFADNLTRLVHSASAS